MPETRVFQVDRTAECEDLRIELAAGHVDIDLWAEKIQRKESLAVLVRRCDYLTHPGFLVCNLDYYLNAIKVMRRNLDSHRFFVFSDKLGWCEENLGGSDLQFVRTRLPARLPAIDLELMTRCRHQVLSNNTFSWWGA